MPQFKKIVKVAINNKMAAIFAVFNLIRKYSFIEYYFGKGYSLYPDFITFVLTKGCNYKCSFCSSHSVGQNLSPNELSTKEWYKVIDEVKKFYPVIYLCGGEPTLRRDYLDIIRYIKRSGLVCAMTTNASALTESKVKELVETSIDFISISLDGNKGIHNTIRGFNTAFDKVVDAVGYINKYRGSSGLPNIKIVGVIDPANPENSLEVAEIASQIGADEVNFGHLMFYPDRIVNDQNLFIENFGIGSEYLTGGAISRVNTSVTQMQLTIKKLKELKKIKVSITQGFNLDVENYYNSDQYPSNKSYCLTPWYSAIVRPDGNISLCMEFDVGNIKHGKNFLDLWNSEGWRKFRILKSKGYKVPACYRCGEGQKIRFENESIV